MRTLFCTLALAAGALLSTPAQAQMKRPDLPALDKSPLDLAWLPRDAPFREKPTDPTPAARILYSRPQKKDRKIFGPDTTFIVPYGKTWRTGANEATELKVYKPLTLGGKKLAVGTYTLYTIPGEKEWTLIVSSDLDRWGDYAYNQKLDVARVKAPVTAAPAPTEAFTIAFKDGAKPGAATLRLVWDTVEVDVPVTY